MARLAVVYHPQKVRLERLRRLVAAGESAAGWEPSLWLPTTQDDHGQGVTGVALTAGADVVAAAGGDGTVRQVATALRGTGVPIALLPQGTGNLLARNLGLPLAPAAAVRTAFGPEHRAIDLGVIAGTRPDGSELAEQVFLVMAGIGIDAEMIRRTSTELKRRLGWVAYADSVWRALPSARPFPLEYAIDGGPARSERVHSLVIANCGSLPVRLEVMPDWRIDDGLLDVAGFRPRGPLGVPKVWWTVVVENGLLRRISWGRRISDRRTADDRDVVYDRGRAIDVEVPEPVGIQVDGDVFGEVIAVRARIDAGALLVKAPAR